MARQLSGKWVSLPQLIHELKQFVATKSPLQDTLKLPIFVNEQGVGADVKARIQRSFTEAHGFIQGCGVDAKKAIANKPADKVYRWKNAKGRWVYSDQPRQNGEMEVVPVASTGKNYFSLSVKYPNGLVPADIKQSLDVNGRGMYRVYKGYLGVDNLSHSSLNILVYGNKLAYENLRDQMAPNLAASTPGFYSSSENKAVVLYQGSRSRTQRLAIHEAAHVINASLFGFTPIWFNEGVAGYFENIEMRGQLIEIHPQRGWLHSGALNSGLMPLQQLLASGHENWTGENRNQYYANAWSLIHFLMEEENKSLMVTLLTDFSQNRCVFKDGTQLLDTHYAGGLKDLSRDWAQWHREKGYSVHRI